jgi:hypothetical protein
MTKVKNRDRAKPKSALNLAEHRPGVAPNSSLSATDEQSHEEQQMQGGKARSEKMNAAPSASPRKKEKQRFGHN